MYMGSIHIMVKAHLVGGRQTIKVETGKLPAGLGLYYFLWPRRAAAARAGKSAAPPSENIDLVQAGKPPSKRMSVTQHRGAIT
jgi:hypothetical protein